MTIGPLPEPADPPPQPWRCERHTAPTACDPEGECDPAWDVPFGPVIEGVPLPHGRRAEIVALADSAKEMP